MSPISTFREWSRRLHENDTNTTKKVITHLTHLEDLVITNGPEGAQQAVGFVTGIVKYLAGHADAPVNISVKIDGAPAIVAGTDPSDNKFFVGTKGAFSKTPKIAKSVEEIKTLYGDKPGLVDVMTVAFTTLQPLRLPKIMQGDVLFTPALKKPQTFEGVSYITFKPNTIVYGVPTESELGQQIVAAQFGICFHTMYNGQSLQTLVASPGVDVERLNTSPDVVFFSSKYQDLSGTVTFSKQEMSTIQSLSSQLVKATTALTTNKFVSLVQSNSLLKSEFMMFQNSLVRSGDSITLTPETFAERFIDTLTTRGESDAGKKLSPKSQATSRDKYAKLAQQVTALETDLMGVLTWQNIIIRIKTLALNKLNMPGKLRTFYTTTTGVIAGPHEGFVAVDTMGNFVKLVDRSYFSKMNMLSGRFVQQAGEEPQTT